MIYRIPLFLISIALVVFLSTGEASACSCVKYDAFAAEHVRKAKRDSDAVFAGKVQSIVEKQRHGWVSVEFEVLDVWKGRLNDKVTVVTGDNIENCGFKFQQGETYLVYIPSHKLYSPKSLSTHLCTRTALLAEAKADIPHLGKRKLPMK